MVLLEQGKGLSVWKKHSDEVLNGIQEMVNEADRGGEWLDSEGYGVLSEDITREEGAWAQQKLRVLVNAAAGKMALLQK